MSNKNRLTERKMLDKRFRKTEEAILAAFFKDDNYITTREMAERAGVAPSTFYRHHATVKRITLDYEDYIINKYNRMMAVVLRKRGIKIRQIFYKMLVFIVANKRIFKILQKSGNRQVLEKMVTRLRIKIIKFARLPCNSDKIFEVYVSEVVTILIRWGEDDFVMDKMREVLDNIMYLTETARVRLFPLNK